MLVFLRYFRFVVYFETSNETKYIILDIFGDNLEKTLEQNHQKL